MVQCLAYRLVFREGAWEGLEPAERLREGLMLRSKRCADDHRRASREVADGLSATTAMLLYTALATKAGVWRLRAKSTSGFSELGPTTHLSFVTYQLSNVESAFYTSRASASSGYNEDKTTHLAGLLGARNEITYVKNFCSVPHMK